jgi:phospholipid/cholesterol/gamma-HCH transport system substrate-binding protein
MSKTAAKHIKLGIFVITGLLLMITTFYMIGKNKNIFGGNYRLKVRFQNIQGLKNGNNVRYAGMDVGTVDAINMLNDTTIEVDLLVNNEMKKVIRKNAVAFIMTDGLVGDKVLNITPGSGTSAFAEGEDIINSKGSFETDEMLRKLEKTNNNITIISDSVLSFMRGIQDPMGVGGLIKNREIATSVKTGITALRQMSMNLNVGSQHLKDVMVELKKGEKGIGDFILNSKLKDNTDSLLQSLQHASSNMDSGITELRGSIDSIKQLIIKGPGILTILLSNEEAGNKMLQTLDHAKQAADNFNQNMEALKHNFLFRGYFKKQSKKQ